MILIHEFVFRGRHFKMYCLKKTYFLKVTNCLGQVFFLKIMVNENGRLSYKVTSSPFHLFKNLRKKDIEFLINFDF
jgi:hypothetical protein